MTATGPGPASDEHTPVKLRRLGRLRVLQSLSDEGEISRPDLVRFTGLSRATVSSVIADLIDEGIVGERPGAAATSRLGRPPLTVFLEPASAYAFGVDIAHDHVRTILSDLSGTSVWEDVVPLDVDGAAAVALDAAASAVRRGLSVSGTDPGLVLGVGLGIACPVDRRTGGLHAQGIMPGWVGVRPADEVVERTGLQARVINDANACVLAERRLGAARTWDDVVYVRLSAGIGAGIVSDGRMLLGHDGLAGEVGHVTVDPQGALCRCGNRGCLETVATPGAIAALLAASWRRPVTTAELADLIVTQDRGVLRAVEDAADAIGRALAAAVMTLNPRLILVGGELAVAGQVLTDGLRRALERNTVASHHQEIEITVSALGDSAAARGAAALLLADAPARLSERAERPRDAVAGGS